MLTSDRKPNSEDCIYIYSICVVILINFLNLKLLKELFALYKNGWRGLYVQLFTIVFLDYNFSSDIDI